MPLPIDVLPASLLCMAVCGMTEPLDIVMTPVDSPIDMLDPLPIAILEPLVMDMPAIDESAPPELLQARMTTSTNTTTATAMMTIRNTPRFDEDFPVRFPSGCSSEVMQSPF